VPAILLSDVLQRLELPRSHRAGANVPDPALLNDVVERLHNFLPRCIAVQAMDLEDVDVRAQALHTLLHRIEDVLPAQANRVDSLAVVCRGQGDWTPEVRFVDPEVAFREEDDLLAWDVVLLEGFADDALGLPVRVNICGINCVNSRLISVLEQR